MDGASYLGIPPFLICTEAAKNVRYPINANHETFGYYKFDFEAPVAERVLLLNDLFFASEHPGGANFCMADGSVQFKRETIEFPVYQNLATKAGEEVIEDE
jgi:prepilin-type processing-associated H-X9-DG protein